MDLPRSRWSAGLADLAAHLLMPTKGRKVSRLVSMTSIWVGVIGLVGWWNGVDVEHDSNRPP